MQGLFSKIETNFFKGIGILMIVFHNYFHSLPEFALENEAGFSAVNVKLFIKHLVSFDFNNWIGSVFGFLGHYGVQIFILFSAYGLSIQFSKSSQSVTQFVLRRLKKIYFLMFFGIAFCIVLSWLVGNPMSLYDIAKKSFLLGSTISSFSDWYLYGMFTGPFWFFALVIQLYIIFPLCYKIITRFQKEKIWLVFLGSYVIIYPIYYFTLGTHFTILGSVFGHLPEVFLGIAMAHFKIKTFDKWIVLAAGIVFVLSQFFEIIFPLSFLAISILLIQAFNWLEKASPTVLKKIIIFTGEISMILFVVNGRFRFLPIFSDFSMSQFMYYIPLLFGLSYILFVLYNALQKQLKI